MRHSIELALDISLAPTRLQGPCLLGCPARRHSCTCMQLMASTRHAIDSRDASLLPWACYVRRDRSRIFLRGGQKAIEYARSNVRGCRAQRAQRAVARGVWGHAPPENF